jgi:N-carbamoyl-L-amino-acid hydrolase
MRHGSRPCSSACARAGEIAQVRGTSIEFRDLGATAVPALTDPRIQRVIAGEAHGLGLTTMAMPSGAGHDAQDIEQARPMTIRPACGW